MSFKGDFNDFELREIMHFIGDRMKDGQLVLKAATREARVDFGKGKITRISLHNKQPLIYRLEEAGFVAAGTAAKLIDAEPDDIAQRQLILSKKLTDKDDLNRFLVREIAKDLAELMFWEEAEFEFSNADEPPPPLVELKVDDAIREAVSMAVELRNLKKRFPDKMLLTLGASPKEKLVTIDPEEWEIVAMFAKQMSVEALAKVTGRDSFSFFELIARVADRGLLVIDETEEPEETEEKDEKENKTEKKPEIVAKSEPKAEPKIEPKAEPQEKKQEPAPINGKYVAVA